MKSLVSVRPRTEEMRRVDYLLKLSIRTQDVHDVTAWHFSNTRRAAAFEDAVQNMKVLHAWMDPNDLDGSNTLDALAERGFVFGRGGMRFDTGTVAPSSSRRPPPSSSMSSIHQQNTPKRLLLCQIGVGKSYVVDDPDAVTALTSAPDGFDSVFLARPSRSPGGDVNPEIYRHEYVMFNPTRALPMYLVQYFEGPAPPEGSRGIAALMDTNQTSVSRFTSPSGGSLNSTGGLPNETIQALYDRYDFFDPILYVPVSVRDKMVGSHSTGEAAQHKLIGIGDAYDAAVAESLKPDPILADRQAELRVNLRAIDAKLQEVNRNSAEVEEKIYKALQDALFELQDATQKRMNALLAEEVELRRQLQHIDWIESFLDRQREEATPVDFLNAWKCHVQLRGDVCRAPIETPVVVASVTADLDLVGGVRVVSREQASEGASLVPHMEPPVVVNAAGRYPIGMSPERLRSGVSQQQQQQQQRGAGQMVMEGNASPPPPPPLFSNTAALQTTPGNGGDISRAWTEALRHQANEQARRFGNTFQRGESVNPMPSGMFEEVPPTPPVVPLKARPKTTSGITPERFTVFSLSADSVRRLHKTRDKPVPETCFPGSTLISDKPMLQQQQQSPGAAPNESKSPEPQQQQQKDDSILSEAQALYLSLPIQGVGRLPPRVSLLFASWTNQGPKTIQAMLKELPVQVSKNPDGIDVSIPLPCPTILVMSANGRRFGGFASHEWRTDGLAFGDAKSFLFSLNQDVRIPFHGRELVDGPTAQGVKFPSLCSDETALKFGNGDLVIANDFISCSSELEHSFGVGMIPGSEECRTFLAGTERFQCDSWELWGVFYP